jgi:hypothetical protein
VLVAARVEVAGEELDERVHVAARSDELLHQLLLAPALGIALVGRAVHVADQHDSRLAEHLRVVGDVVGEVELVRHS